MARYWKTSLALSLAGLLAGLAVAFNTPISYRAEARLAVGPVSNSAYVIAGYPLAARDLAANYSRWVENNGHDGTWTAPGVTSITASPIPDSGVIRLEAEGRTAEQAVAGAQAAADRLVTLVGNEQDKVDPRLAYAQYVKLAPKVAGAQAAVENARSDRERIRSRVTLASLQLQRDAYAERYRRQFSDPQNVSRLKPISPAASVGDDRTANLIRFGLLGLGTGLFLALLTASARGRRDVLPTAQESPAPAAAPSPWDAVPPAAT
ncbi:MAG TPA: hypothetical protein VES02_13515 [Dermatophilaceae bacterium]|nr:hypothetical protein [Dermatophilaceae bacterium]